MGQSIQLEVPTMAALEVVEVARHAGMPLLPCVHHHHHHATPHPYHHLEGSQRPLKKCNVILERPKRTVLALTNASKRGLGLDD